MMLFNYDAWRELFLTHCLAFDVLGHVDGTSNPTGDDDTPWKKKDGLVKLWIYGTLASPLFKTCFKTGGTTRDIWLRIGNQFRNNKEARAIQLDNDLRTKEIGDMSIHDYSLSLKAIADLLENVEAPVSDKTLVMYMLNGLNERFDHIINVIKHQKPLTKLETCWRWRKLASRNCTRVPSFTQTIHPPQLRWFQHIPKANQEISNVTSLAITEETNEEDVDVGATTTTTTVSLTTIWEFLCLFGLANTTGKTDLKRLG